MLAMPGQVLRELAGQLVAVVVSSCRMLFTRLATGSAAILYSVDKLDWCCLQPDLRISQLHKDLYKFQA